MGVPWHTAATVRSVAHTSSLSVMSKSHAPGEAPKLLEVKEQRLTNLLGMFLDSILIDMKRREAVMSCMIRADMEQRWLVDYNGFHPQ